MRSRAGIIGAGLLGWALTAHAYTSPYSAMAVAGNVFSEGFWSSTPNMVLVADNTWQGTQTVTAASGFIKFTANGSWDINWGGISDGSVSIVRVPAIATAPVSGGGNLSFARLSNGLYRFTFNDSTHEFRMEWAGASPLPMPSITNLYLVGDFNGWTPSGSGRLTNSPANTNLWIGSVDLEADTAFQFRPNGNADGQWGAPEAATLAVPVTNGNACGTANFALSGFEPGTFLFTLNTSNVTFTISQTSTQTFSGMTVQGNFIATNNPPPNMTRLSGTTIWESDHYLTNSGTITVRFASDNNTKRWGATNASPIALPASGTLATGLTAYANVSGVVPGRYRITFDHQTGNFTFRQVYADTSGLNLLKNPGFEQTTDPNGGYAVDWGFGGQAWPKDVSYWHFAPHSGSWCGVLHAKWYNDWVDYGSFAQDVLVTAGRNYRASAWFKASAEWTATTMQIKMEWLDATNGAVGDAVITLIPALSNSWVHYSAEGIAPEGATKAHVVFLCAGTGTAGTMQIDDAEMRAVSGRTQNFDTWGTLEAFGPFSPDWSITSGRTVLNVPPGRPAAGVFISQYIEGTGNNKAIEIFNGTLSNLDLAAESYALQQYNNGSLTASVSMALSGTIQPGACLVVARPNAPTNYQPDIAIGGLPNLLTNKYVTFNGDDVVVLSRGATVVDRVGQVGTNATGSIWSRNTKDHTLTRKQTIFTGTVSAVTSSFPMLTEWNLSACDNFTDLGSHEISYLDPNEPYTPAGLSLVMNTNATLMSGDLPGGVGDVSFWYRTESMSPAVTLSIETAVSEDGPWTTNVTLSGIASSNFAYYVVAISRADALYVRFRQTDGGTNRFRIDEISVTEPSTVKRFEDFSGWTDPAYETPGSYSRYGWSLVSASIAPTTGVYNSRAALLSPPSSAVSSPAYEQGVGETIFWTKAVDSGSPAYLLLQTTIDGGSNWYTQGSFTATTGTTYTTWLYLTNNPTQARIIFDPAKNSGDALVDNIEVRVPILYRNQNFDGWPYKSTYTNGTSAQQGWSIGNCLVDAQYSYEGMAARLNSAITGSAYIQGPYFPDGIGSISYRLRKVNSGDTSPSIQIQVSPNGSGWTTIATNTASSTNYEQFVLFHEDTTNHFVRFVHTAGASAVPVDDIRIGIPQPRPEITITPGSSPSAPSSNETVLVTADILTHYGASIVAVTGYYWVATGSTSAVPMTAVAYGSYASVSSIPAQIPGTSVHYYVQVWYSGIGAAPASSGYTTNLASSVTNLYQISSVAQGDVWINEISYLSMKMDLSQNEEYIELCGLAGSSISNWTIQLAFGADTNIAANSNQAVYASYRITAGHTFTNQTNGFSFYVLGDQQLLDAGKPINKVLTTLVPPVADNWGDDHIQDARGVIRLLNEYSNVVYSLSYAGYATGSDRIPASQTSLSTNSVALMGSGSSYDQFLSWTRTTNLTIGAINDDQTLVPPGGIVLAEVWHIPDDYVVPLNTNIAAFYMRDPFAAQYSDPLWIHYGFSTTNYTLPDGTLYYRQLGYPTWNTLAMSVRAGSGDAHTNLYVAATIPLHTYTRGTSIQYFLQANPNKTGISTAYIGQGTTNDYAIFERIEDAKNSPFQYTYAVRSDMLITNFVTNATSWLLYTIGNDTYQPFTNFKIYLTTNLQLPTTQWSTSRFTVTPIDAFGQNTFTVPKTNLTPKVFYRIDPR